MKKKNVLILIVVGVVAVLGVALFLILNNTQEKKLERSLKEMGRDFYEDYYYDQTGETLEDREKFLKPFKTIGIKVTLDGLSRYNSKENQAKIEEFVNRKTNEKCDTMSTRAIIYPKEKYGKTDYDIKVELSCGFDKE